MLFVVFSLREGKMTEFEGDRNMDVFMQNYSQEKIFEWLESRKGPGKSKEEL